MSTVSKSGSLNSLEPSGPVQARNGIALPLPVLMFPQCRINLIKFVIQLLLISNSILLTEMFFQVYVPARITEQRREKKHKTC